MNEEKKLLWQTLQVPALWIGALGYFVDLYDLVLFGVVRIPSLKALGVPEAEFLSMGAFLLNCQMIGLLLGGFFWGALGDKYGRLRVLYGSILIYSLAYLANAWVTSVTIYGLLRFIAGFGLAGELGGAITLVAESLPARARGYGSALIGAAGFMGALLAATVGAELSWRVAYTSGGLLGLLLLVLRFKTTDSSLFERAKQMHQQRGKLAWLLSRPILRRRFLLNLFVGLPIWLVSGVLIYFAPELSHELGITTPVSAPQAIFWSYAGTIFGDIFSGIASQLWRSRIKVIFVYLLILATAILIYGLGVKGCSAFQFKLVCFLLGLGTGYWVLFVLTTAEQFGTNLRATVATSAPNLARGGAIPLVALFRWGSPHFGGPTTVLGLGGFCLALAFFALSKLPETYNAQLDFLED